MLSIWERNQFVRYDHILIGSGIVGLSAAYYLKKRFPAASVLILERGLLPSGASTKNAGFACMGSLTEILDDLTTSTEEEVLNLFLLRKRGLERLQTILTPSQSGYRANGSYELILESEKHHLEQLHHVNQLLRRELYTDAFSIQQDKLTQFGFAGVHTLIENHCEGELDTGLLIKNFIALVLSMGVEIKTGCEVMALHEQSNEVEVHCKNPIANGIINFVAQQVYVCNNAFAQHLLPSLEITPGRGQVLLTEPIPNLKFKGIFHFDQGYYYFREYQGRILFGGGRQLDKLGETTTKFGLHPRIQQDLEHKLHTLILPHLPVTIDLRWSGIMAFGPHKRPLLCQHTPRIAVGVRMGGMGMAIGCEIGHQLSKMGE